MVEAGNRQNVVKVPVPVVSPVHSLCELALNMVPKNFSRDPNQGLKLYILAPKNPWDKLTTKPSYYWMS